MRVLVALLLLLSTTRASCAADLLIVGATVIDATGAPPSPDAAVAVHDDRITAVGPAASVRLVPGAQVIDARGKFLIPGLWDLHVHVLREGRPEAYFPLLVANGITGLRDMGGSFDFARIAQLQREVLDGSRIGPRFYAPGPIVDGPYPQLASISVVVATPAAAREEVATLARAGADFVKVFNRVPRDAFFALAAEARERRLPFAGHVPMAVSAREASDAGMASIEHLFNVAFACSSREDELMRRKAEAQAGGLAGERRRLRRTYLRDALDSFDPARCDALYARFVRNGTWMTPTLVERRAFAEPDPHFKDDPQRRFIPRSVRALWDPAQDERIAGREAEDRDLEQRAWARDRTLIAPMRRAGVRFLAGTDAGDVYSIPGTSLHTELELLVEAGLTPLEALQAATRNAGDFFGHGEAFGTIQPGRSADLVLLDADPLADIRHTRAIAGVLLRGRWFDRATLDRLLAEAAATAERS